MQVINLDLSVKVDIPSLQAKQGDVGRKFGVVITDGGEAYEIPAGTTLSVWYSGTGGEGNYSEIGLKDSSVVESRSAFTISGNTVTVELVAQMLACPGGGTLCLVMNGAEGDQIATWNIPYNVEKIPGANSEGATQYYTAQAQAAMREMSAALERALEDAKASGEFDGPRGIQGEKGEKGEDGTVAFEDLTEEQKAFLKGEPGVDGKDYVLTNADKIEIAEMVEGITVVQAPLFVDDAAKMTDTSRVYVLNSTGHIWAYMDTPVEKEVTVTDRIEATDDNPYIDNSRLSSGDDIANDVSGYHVTPMIDLTKYEGRTIQLHLDGGQYSSTGTYALYIQSRYYGSNKNVIIERTYTADSAISDAYVLYITNGISITRNGETSTTITIAVPPTYADGTKLYYMRFCGKGAIADSSIYITYSEIQTVTGGQWVDTGVTYSPALTDEEKQIMVNEVAELVDAQLLSMVGDGMVTV